MNPIPNIVICAPGRRWFRDIKLSLFHSSDGWTITDQQIADLPPAEGERLLEALRSAVTRRPSND